MRALLAIVLVLLLSGFSCSRNVKRVPAQCNQICFVPCTSADGDTGVRWDADPAKADAWDTLGGDVVPLLAGQLRTCEVHRKACTQCLQRLHDAKVIEL